MLENLIQAGCFIAIIILGFLLRKFNFFNEETFPLLSKIVLKITLPAAIISNFSGKELDMSILTVALVGFGSNLIYVIAGYFTGRNQNRTTQAFFIQNLPGYNIGNFIVPFTQSFLGPTGVITASLLDVGNSVFCLGGAFSIASVVKNGNRFSPKRIGKTLIKAIAFDTYVIMTVLSLLNVRLPAMVVSLADLIGSANIFLGMLMLGVGLRIPRGKTQIGQIAKILLLRYSMATAFALLTYFFLPFSTTVRCAVVLTLFAPIASAAPAFTNELGGDVGLSSAVNSASVICSIVIIVFLTVFLF